MARRTELDGRAVDPDPPAGDAFDAEQRAADLLLARAPQADESNDFTRMDAAIDRPDRTDFGTLELEPRRPFALGGSPEHQRGLAPHDEQDRFVGRGPSDNPLARDAAVAQYHHPVGDLEHLVEPVRDVDHADAVLAQAPERTKQAHYLVGRQARSRLIENEDLRFGCERTRDRDQRFLRSCEVLDPQIRIDIGADLCKRVARRAFAPETTR